MAGQEGDKKPRPNRVPTGSGGGPGGFIGLGLNYREAAKQVRVCGGIKARDLYRSATEHTEDTENGDIDAHSTLPLPLPPPAARVATGGATVFWETRFLRGRRGKEFWIFFSGRNGGAARPCARGGSVVRWIGRYGDDLLDGRDGLADALIREGGNDVIYSDAGLASVSNW